MLATQLVCAIALVSGQAIPCMDTPNWTNGPRFNKNCANYEEYSWCCGGSGACAGAAWTLGADFNNPEDNCCICGKVPSPLSAPPSPPPAPPSPPPAQEDSNSVCIPDASKCDSSIGNDCTTAADTSLEKRKCHDSYIAIYTGFSCTFFGPPCNFFTCYPPSCDNLPEDKCGPNECNTDTSDAIGIGIIILIVVAVLGLVIVVLLCWKKGCCCFARQQQKGPVMTSVEQVAVA